MSALAGALGGEATYEGMLVLVVAQLAFWSVIFEGAEPVARVVLSLFPFWGRYEKFKTSSGRMVWQEISVAFLIGLQHFIGFSMMVYGALSGDPVWFRYGVTSKVAFELNDLLLMLLGARRHEGAPGAARVLMLGYHGLTICLGFAVCVGYAADPNVRLIALSVLGSSALLSMLVPFQYVINMMSKSGSKANVALHGLNFVVFCVCRFVVGFLPRPSAYVEVLQTAQSPIAIIGVVLLFASGLLVASLLFDRVKKARKLRKDVQALRVYFEKKKDDKTTEEQIQTHIWTKSKVDEVVLGSEGDMLRAKLKAGLFGLKVGVAKKTG